jgi:hypothetical protein
MLERASEFFRGHGGPSDSDCHLGDYDRYVVASSMDSGAVDEVVHNRSDISASGHGHGDLFERQLVEEPVAAHDNSVSFVEDEGRVVNHDIGSDAEGPREDTVIGMLRCLLFPQLSARDEFGRHAVVLG